MRTELFDMIEPIALPPHLTSLRSAFYARALKIAERTATSGYDVSNPEEELLDLDLALVAATHYIQALEGAVTRPEVPS